MFCSLMVSNIASAGLYDQATAQGAKWLAAEQNRNKDGSWGESPDTQPIYTSAAILALDASYKRQNAYFAGLTWLENHASSNVDLLSRRVGALTSHGDTLSYVLSYLQNTQVHNGASYFGWGLSPGYTSSAIDTALALIAYADMKQNLTEQVEAALVFLKNNQRTKVNDKGWTISNANTSDPAVTALVIQALSRFATQDTSLNIVIENGLETLNSLVDVSAPPILQALAAQAS